MTRAQKKSKLLSLYGSIRAVARQYTGDPRVPYPVDDAQLRYYLSPKCQGQKPDLDNVIALAIQEGPVKVDWPAIRATFERLYPSPRGRSAFVAEHTGPDGKPLFSRKFVDRIMVDDPKRLHNPKVQAFLTALEAAERAQTS